MTKTEAEIAFKKEVDEVSSKHLKKLQEYMLTNYNELSIQFLECFKNYCQKVVAMQASESDKKGSLGYIHFSLMRTKLIEGAYEFRIDAYDKGWYADKNFCVGTYGVYQIFRFLEDFSKELIERRRKYIQKITVVDVKRYGLEESNKYISVMTGFIRSVIPQAVKLSDYEAIKRENVFEIAVGEFRDAAELVYKEDRTEKDVEKVVRYLNAKQENGYRHEVLDELIFEGVNFKKALWLYFSGKNSRFFNTDISESSLMFCKFENGEFNSIDFTNSYLVGINFSGARLRNLNFEGARIMNVSFENATLEKIDFSRAEQLANVNLTNATLIDVLLPDDLEVG